MPASRTPTDLLSIAIDPVEGFADFYRAQYPRLAGSLRAVCGDGDLAADLAQEAFARALLHWDRLRDYDQPAGWAYRTAFNLLRRHWQKAGRDEEPLIREVPATESEGDRVDLSRALATLPYRQRQAVVLRHVLDYSTEDVAGIMEISPGALRMTLHRAMESLRHRYDIDLAPEGESS